MRTRWMLIGMLAIAAGALGIRPMMHASSAPSVSVPHSADVASDDVHASTARPSTFTAAPANAPGTLTLQEPPIEPQEVLESMSKDELKTDIAQIDEELARRDAIKRLNEETVSPEERVELGAMIHRLALMKNQLVNREVDEVSQAVAEYEKGHAARVAQYVHKKK